MTSQPEQLDAVLRACAAGELPPNVALMRLILETRTEEELSRVLDEATGAASASAAPRLRAVADLLGEHPGAFALLRRTIADAPHDEVGGEAEERIARWSAAFDRIAETAPDAGSALYALGSPDLLARATGEVVDAMNRWNLISSGTDVLEIGCGSGRFVAALSRHVRSVTGIDSSPRMVEAARRRCAGLPNVRLRESSGRDLAGIADRSVDLVLAADVFPYLVSAGVGIVAAHLSESGRVLRPDGALLILNFSYRGDSDRDLRDLQAALPEAGLNLEAHGSGDFALWDATRYLIRKASGA